MVRGSTKTTTGNKMGRPIKGPRFTIPVMQQLIEDMQSKRLPLPLVRLSDDQQQNHRAIVYNSGKISFHVQFRVKGKDGERPLLLIGDYPKMTIERSRKIARTIIALADKGIDPREGLHERLIREIETKGENWRP